MMLENISPIHDIQPAKQYIKNCKTVHKNRLSSVIIILFTVQKKTKKQNGTFYNLKDSVETQKFNTKEGRINKRLKKFTI